MTSASCPTTLTTCRPCWMNYERMHEESLSLSIHISLRWCALTLTPAIYPLSFDGAQLPYTDSFKYLGMVCDRQINLYAAADAVPCPFTAGTFHIKQFIREHDLTIRLHICMWLLKTYAIPAGMYASQVWATLFLQQGKEMDLVCLFIARRERTQQCP